MEDLLGHIKLRVQAMCDRIVRSNCDDTVAITEDTVIAFRNRIKVRLELKILQVHLERIFALVVIDLSVIKYQMAHAKIENIGLARTAGTLHFRQIGRTVFVDNDPYDGVIERHLIQVALTPKQRNNGEADTKVIDLQEWLCVVRLCGIDGHVVHVNRWRQSVKTDRKVPQAKIHTGLVEDFLVGDSQHIPPESIVVD